MTVHNWDRPHPFTLEVAAEAAHIDGLGHTNNAVYVSWCERVAWAHSAALGLDLAAYQRLNRAMVITNSEFDYLQASRLGEIMVAATWITGWDGRLTMRRAFQIYRPADQTTVLRARMKFACIDLETGRARRMPQEFIDGYRPAIIEESGV